MNIDSKLTDFQNKIGNNLSKYNSSLTNLTSDIENFKSLNVSIDDQLSISFKGEGGESVKPEVEYINQTVDKIINSLNNEFKGVLNKCSELNSGINELKNLLQQYESLSNEYNNLSDKAKESSSIPSEMGKIETEFKNKQTSLLAIHSEILNMDSSVTILKEFGVEDTSLGDSLLSGVQAKYSGVSFSSIYYEKDGIIYQKVVPICKNNQSYTMNEQFMIVYDKNAILNSGGEAGAHMVNFLQGKVNGTETNQYLWDLTKYSYKSDYVQQIANAMDQVLIATYNANNAKTVSDYASLTAMVATNSVLHLSYGKNQQVYSKGFSEILKNGGKLDCIAFVRWCYYQGVDNTGSQNLMRIGNNAMQIVNVYSQNSIPFSSLTEEQLNNIEVGSVLTKKIPDNYHIGIVIGTTTVDKEPAVIVAQSSNATIGTNTRVYKIKDLGTEGNWERIATPSNMSKRVAGVSSGTTYA